ncbi:MAG TPA: DDE-type integrase/transposase/recombinase [Dermatophilaceae bacterium]
MNAAAIALGMQAEVLLLDRNVAKLRVADAIYQGHCQTVTSNAYEVEKAIADAYPVDAAKRDRDKGELNRVWVGDITYLRTWEGWLYLATVIDAHSRRVIGWAIDEHMRADLVQDVLAMAITLRGDLPAKVVFHSDRGTQYASAQITAFAAANGLTRSMGYTG